MAQIADIPIIGGVLHSFSVYFSKSAEILRNPFGFARRIDFEDRIGLKKAWEFLLPSIIVSYLICIPALLEHKPDISQPLFVVSQFLRMAVVVALLHIALKALGSRKPLRTTFISYCYTAGLFLPIVILVALPILMAVGPNVDFVMIDPAVRLADYHSPDTGWLVYMSSILFMVFGLTVTLVSMVWISRIHEIVTFRAVLPVIIALLISMPVIQYIYFPVFDHLEG